MTQYAYLVCPLGEYRRFYQIDVKKEWAEGRIRIFHKQCLGVITFSRDPKYEYLRCKACGSRVTVDFTGVSAAIRAIAIDRGGIQVVNDQIRFSYLDPGDLPAD